MVKTFDDRRSVKNFLFSVAETFDFLYSTTYHNFDLNIDWNSFVEQIKVNKNYPTTMKLGFRERGIESGDKMIELWGDGILNVIVVEYNPETKKYTLTSNN